jgi:hypothetical protein
MLIPVGRRQNRRENGAVAVEESVQSEAKAPADAAFAKPCAVLMQKVHKAVPATSCSRTNVEKRRASERQQTGKFSSR